MHMPSHPAQALQVSGSGQAPSTYVWQLRACVSLLSLCTVRHPRCHPNPKATFWRVATNAAVITHFTGSAHMPADACVSFKDMEGLGKPLHMEDEVMLDGAKAQDHRKVDWLWGAQGRPGRSCGETCEGHVGILQPDVPSDCTRDVHILSTWMVHFTATVSRACIVGVCRPANEGRMGKQDKGLIPSNPNLTQMASDLMRRAGIMLREHMGFFQH